jgi:hypothetical protein
MIFFAESVSVKPILLPSDLLIMLQEEVIIKSRLENTILLTNNSFLKINPFFEIPS